MKKGIYLLMISMISLSFAYGQKAESKNDEKYLVGFSLFLPTGVWPATALSNMGTTSFLKDQGHDLKSYGFGLQIQRKFKNNFSIFSDIYLNNYNIFLASQGEDVQSIWTVEQSAIHWDEPDAPQILYVSNLPTDVAFDMQSTGIRIGAKYSIGKKNIKPWGSFAFGYYMWTVNYFNDDKTKTYGTDSDYVTGLTYQLGVDFKLVEGIVLTIFADLTSPVADYHIEGLFYPQWDIDYSSHIMGTKRYGITLSFTP